jgi:hypothetical protein
MHRALRDVLGGAMRRRATIGVAVLAVMVLVGGGAAWAQQDPYSGGTAVNGAACAPRHPSVTVDRTHGLFVGDPLVATMHDYTPGTAINVTFDGLPFGSGTADASGTSEVHGAVPDLPPGDYFICAEAAGCDAACVDPGLVVLGRRPGARVLGVQFQRDAGGSSGSALARTGIDIALLLLLALGLILTGLWLRRRRRAVSAS